jgi:hypothetical protein
LELCPLILDGVEQPLKVKLHSNCFDDELFQLFLEKPLFVPAARLGPFGNYGAHTLVDLEPALLDQVLNGFMRSVRVDFESECQGSNGREGLPRLELAADKGLLRGENHLVDNGFAWLEVDAKSCHMDNVTPVTEGVKEESGRGWQPWQNRLVEPILRQSQKRKQLSTIGQFCAAIGDSHIWPSPETAFIQDAHFS